jgi:hypothetical protein
MRESCLPGGRFSWPGVGGLSAWDISRRIEMGREGRARERMKKPHLAISVDDSVEAEERRR